MTLRIRAAVAADAARLVVLLDELNAAMGEPVGHNSIGSLTSDGFAPGGWFHVLVAEDWAEIQGYALLCPAYSTEFGQRGFYLQDLLVTELARGRGTGRALMAAAAAWVKARDGSFLWWCSKPWNSRAQAFYRSLGAIEEPIVAHAIYGAAFEQLASLACEGEMGEAPPHTPSR